ncbi:hypothetical protein SAMN06265222_12134 [Neorhodopirellula lusitana]|uniref:Uncharacterized protein n=1 Tax=Neorhodopirellula lusitana TaxID=445327 RepID=A0ABY1QPE8_9BACT|nr:hypothetical protein SAMN06265222_12134 [Neorhodopirellula lusitana]
MLTMTDTDENQEEFPQMNYLRCKSPQMMCSEIHCHIDFTTCTTSSTGNTQGHLI